jgi:hypothetical protein
MTLRRCYYTMRRKGVEQGRLGLRSAAGAGFAEWARQWLVLERIGSFKPATGEHRLRLTAAGSAGHAGSWVVDWREGNLTDVGGRCWHVGVKPVERAPAGKADETIAATCAAVVAAT